MREREMYVREDDFLWQRFCSVLQRFANDIYPCLFSSLACKRMVMELMISWVMARRKLRRLEEN